MFPPTKVSSYTIGRAISENSWLAVNDDSSHRDVALLIFMAVGCPSDEVICTVSQAVHAEVTTLGIFVISGLTDDKDDVTRSDSFMQSESQQSIASTQRESPPVNIVKGVNRILLERAEDKSRILRSAGDLNEALSVRERLRRFVSVSRLRKGVLPVIIGVVIVAVALVVIPGKQTETSEGGAKDRQTSSASSVPSNDLPSPFPSASPMTANNTRDDPMWITQMMSTDNEGTLQSKLAATIGWRPGMSVAVRELSRTGDVGLYVVCAIDATGRSLCQQFTSEESASGRLIRELIQPAN